MDQTDDLMLKIVEMDSLVGNCQWNYHKIIITIFLWSKPSREHQDFKETQGRVKLMNRR